MSAKNTAITQLDFDAIKANLKTFLAGQPEFTDYNFEGSALSLLLDLLAYNTHYMGFYANMQSNEAFMDTAVKRSSLISHAKAHGYTTRSARGATAIVDLEVIIPTDVTIPPGATLPAYTAFGSAGVGTNSSFVFYNSDAHVITAEDSGRFWLRNLEIKEGSRNRTRFTVATANPDQRFIIPNKNIDTSTLTCTVQTSSTDTTVRTFTLAGNYTTVTGDDPVYFLQEVDGFRYEVYFGDGNIGIPVQDGNIITLEYLVVAGSQANGLSTFQMTGTLQSTESNDTFAGRVDTLEAAAGGDEIESDDSIRFYAPKAWTSQNRLVTKSDYEHYILNNLPNVESVSIWGGEDNIPPQYGKVFISLKPLSGFKFSNTAKKNFANNFLDAKSLVSIIPEFIDPEYNYIGIRTAVSFDQRLTTKNSGQINLLVRSAISTFFDETLQKFNKNFYYSKLTTLIDEVDPSIQGNLTIITLQKRLTPSLNRRLGYTVNFAPNALHPSTLTTSYFNIVVNNDTQFNRVRFVDVPNALNFSSSYDGSGFVNLQNSSGETVYEAVGVIDYATGLITIDTVEFLDAKTNDGLIRFTCDLQEDSRDVAVLRNNIITLDDSVADATAGIANNGLIVTVSVV